MSARAKVQRSLRCGESDPAQPLVLHLGLVVDLALPAGHALGGPAAVPLPHVPRLAPQPVRRHRHLRTSIVHGHGPICCTSCCSCGTSSSPFLLSISEILEALPRDLQHGEAEGAGLAAASLRGHEDVSATEDERDGLRLHVRRQAKPQRRQCIRAFIKDNACIMACASMTYVHPISSTALPISGSTPNSGGIRQDNVNVLETRVFLSV